MAKWHIKKDGTPGICHAEKGKCPLGGASGTEDHFDTRAEAQAIIDKRAARDWIWDQTMPKQSPNWSKVHKVTAAQNKKMSKIFTDLFTNSDKARKPEDCVNAAQLKAFYHDDNYTREIPYSEYLAANKRYPELYQNIRKSVDEGKLSPDERESSILEPGKNNVSLDPLNCYDNLSDTQKKFLSTVYRGHANTPFIDNIDSVIDKKYNLSTQYAMTLMDDRFRDDNIFTDMPKDAPGYSPDEWKVDGNAYVNAAGTIYNVVHSKNATDFRYKPAFLAMQGNSVKKGDIRLKMSATDPEDIKADCGTFAAARKYATEVEGFDMKEVGHIIDKEGLVNHFRKSAGLSKRQTSNIERTNLELLKKTKGFDSSKYNNREKQVIAEYAMNKPMKDWDTKLVQKAIKDNPKDHDAPFPVDTTSRYDTMRLELGMYPHMDVATGAFTRDELTKYKLWDRKDPLIHRDSRVGIHQGYIRRDKNNPFKTYDVETGKRYVLSDFYPTTDETNYIMKHFYGVNK